MLITDPAKAAAALRESDDPYGLKLKGASATKRFSLSTVARHQSLVQLLRDPTMIAPRLRARVHGVGRWECELREHRQNPSGHDASSPRPIHSDAVDQHP